MIVQELRRELHAAHIIIRHALNVITFEQKRKWASANERDGLLGEGITRANERDAVINGGSGVALLRELSRANLIIENATALVSHHQAELWAVSNKLAGVISGHPTRDDSRRALLLRACRLPAHELVSDDSVRCSTVPARRPTLTRAQARTVECADAWLRAQGLPAYSELYAERRGVSSTEASN